MPARMRSRRVQVTKGAGRNEVVIRLNIHPAPNGVAYKQGSNESANWPVDSILVIIQH